MSAGIIITARENSLRLPLKHIADVCGQSLLSLLVHRLKPLGLPIRLAVPYASRTYAKWALEHEVDCVFGSAHDVLARIVAASEGFDPVVVVHGDSPLVGPAVVQDVLLRLPPHGASRNVFPSGFRVWAAAWNVLFDVEKHSRIVREHASLVLTPPKYPIAELTFSDIGVDLSVDTADDLERVRKVVTALGPDASEREYIALAAKA